MCGIVGYVGSRDAVPILLGGLKNLEYRGYDSAGLATQDAGGLQIRRRIGRLSALEVFLESHPARGTTGIGHTRWATHGEPSEINSHPHLDCTGQIAVVHNGIIENYEELRRRLQSEGHQFKSETDTEAIPHLIEAAMKAGASSVEEAIRVALRQARGAYALGILHAGQPGRIYAARQGSPLVLGIGNGENFIGSDVTAIINWTKEVVYLDDGDLAVLSADGVEVSDLDGKKRIPEVKTVNLRPEAVERAGFETFMLKEIHEQPRVLRRLLEKHLGPDHRILLPDAELPPAYFRRLNRIMIVACGTAYHAGMYGKLLLENLTSVAVEIDLASEFRYRDPKIDPGTLIVAVSQSGETADTLASVRMAKSWGCKALSVCNVPGSTLARESDAIFFTEAGPEIGVASTKAYTAQLMAFCLLAIHIGRCRGEIAEPQAVSLLQDLHAVPDAIHYVLLRAALIQAVASKHHDGPNSLYLGRRFNYPTALEGALKNKEISYQHAEGYAAGEMKHGPIALINEYMPVVCVCTRTRDEVYDKMVSNVKEVEARHGRIIVLATDGDHTFDPLAEDLIHVPPVRDEFSPLVNVVALQLLAYYAAQARGTDIDKPRNLAKSVTVE